MMWGLKTKELQKYGTYFTTLAQMGELDPVIGREKEIELLIQSLTKRRKSNACLVGNAGVGKTAIVEALALKIARDSVPRKLRGKKIFSIDLARIVDGAMNSEEIEKRVKDVLDEVRGSEGKIILFMDNLHNFIREDGVATTLKLYLSRDHDIKVIGAIRVEEYITYVERNGAFKLMFETIKVSEPSREESIKMLQGIIHKYQAHHGAFYTQTAIISAVDLSKNYIRELCLPEKAIDLIDKAGARVKMLGLTHVTEVEIEQVLSTSTGIRLTQVSTEEEAASLLQLEDIMKLSVIGQDEAVAAVCGSIRRARVGMRDETKPIGCFLFAGPTGVGKTEMAKVLSKEYFGSEAAMVRLDARKFMEHHIVSRLIGQLAEEVRRRPHCLVLFDEIEKAHEEVLNAVLQILNSARLSDGEGKDVDFSDTVVIVISNAERHSYKAEVVNGFDKVVVFKPLEKEHIKKILEIMIERFRSRVLMRNKVRIEVSKSLKEWLVSIGFDKSYGARVLKRAFATFVETKLADEILCGRVAQRDTVMLDVTLTGDVLCQISRVKISQTGQDSDSDSDARFLRSVTIVTTDANGQPHTKSTIGGVDSDLVLSRLNKHRHRNPIKRDDHGVKIGGVDRESFLQIVKSFYV